VGGELSLGRSQHEPRAVLKSQVVRRDIELPLGTVNALNSSVIVLPLGQFVYPRLLQLTRQELTGRQVLLLRARSVPRWLVRNRSFGWLLGKLA
jgi:hypothetical protein